MVAIGALSKASPTLPIEGWIDCRATRLQYLVEGLYNDPQGTSQVAMATWRSALVRLGHKSAEETVNTYSHPWRTPTTARGMSSMRFGEPSPSEESLILRTPSGLCHPGEAA